MNSNQPKIIKYIDREMPVIIFTCCNCHVELFRSITFENKTLHENYCLTCVSKLKDEAWKYRELSK